MSVDKLPSGTKHLFGTMFSVRLSMIKVADGGFDPTSTELSFFNPRWTEMNGKRFGVGFSAQEMQDLREDIQTEGLNHPLRCRWFPYQHPRTTQPKGVQLVDGERRFRSLSLLVKENVLCFDVNTGQMRPARELYEWIECRVTEIPFWNTR